MTDILDNLASEVDKMTETTEPAKASPKKEALVEEEKDSSVMATLMSDDDVKFPEINDVTEGTVIEIGTNAIYLDIDPFGTGIVIGREIKDGLSSGKLKPGNKVSATIIDLENEDGYIELSIREASYEKAWEDLDSKRDTQEKVVTKVLSANKGGLLVEVNGVSGFLPVSQLSSKNYPRVEDGDKNKILNLLKKLVGQELEVRILDADREAEKLIVSEKAAQKEKDRQVISGLQIGDVIEGEISGVVDFGAFIKFHAPDADASKLTEEDKLEGLVHISELAWQLIENPRDIVKAGQKIKAQIIGIDNDKISLSIRALESDPWANLKYSSGDIVKGTVNKINHFGAFVFLDSDIHGLAHISEMSEMYPGKNINDLIKEGEKYDWKILSVEPKEHRMGLALVDKKAKKEKVEKEAVADETKEEKKEKKETKEKKAAKEKPTAEKEKKEEKEVKKTKKKKVTKKVA